MLRTVGMVLAIGALTACSVPKSVEATGAGKFVAVGPVVDAQAPKPALRWVFGLEASLPADEIASISFTCPDLAGASASLTGDAVKADADGNFYALSESAPVSNLDSPWLFLPEMTIDRCRAELVSRSGQHLLAEQPVAFNRSSKAKLLAHWGLKGLWEAFSHKAPQTDVGHPTTSQ